MQITIQIKNNYGVNTVYPVCETAKQFAAIAGTKTLTVQVLKIIEGMGYTITEQQQPTFWKGTK